MPWSSAEVANVGSGPLTEVIIVEIGTSEAICRRNHGSIRRSSPRARIEQKVCDNSPHGFKAYLRRAGSDGQDPATRTCANKREGRAARTTKGMRPRLPAVSPWQGGSFATSLTQAYVRSGSNIRSSGRKTKQLPPRAESATAMTVATKRRNTDALGFPLSGIYRVTAAKPLDTGRYAWTTSVRRISARTVLDDLPTPTDRQARAPDRQQPHSRSVANPYV